MTKYILSDRSFRDEFLKQIQKIDSNYQFVLEDDLTNSEDWQNVEITIGWKKVGMKNCYMKKHL
ncbi:hypothetical protein GCM10025857_61150 [Alicyclobacillus contaminans]|uniref:Uncharacterized protein n=1 Tax=Tetragenococcus osmophilus TaxID=526944 RepID=A0AA37XIR6_9ENTE|nr:hypothetical protein GCM10025857_61150 [Alicyclobacillus contaminans]GMA71430.1 hypothetical protein GCM10025885_04790 [Tetragenococcus osmophilus]